MAFKTKYINLFFLSPLLLAQISPKEAVKALESYHQKTNFKADFEQTFTHAVFKKQQKSTGTLYYKRIQKRLFVRFDYEAPQKKQLFINEKGLFIWEEGQQNAFLDACFSQNELVSTLTFLWSQKPLKQVFHMKFFEDKLELIPKNKQPFYERIFMTFDLKKSIKTVTLLDAQKNENRFEYKTQSFTSLNKDLFYMKKPTLPLPGSCRSQK